MSGIGRKQAKERGFFMPAPVILFYTPTPQSYTPKLLQLCALQRIKLRILDPSCLERPLSVLVQALPPAEPVPAGESLPEPLLIFCHLSDRQLDQALMSLRSIQARCLKAVLTPTNARWTPRELYGELCRERAQLGDAHSSEA